jgi:hypothetical protein
MSLLSGLIPSGKSGAESSVSSEENSDSGTLTVSALGIATGYIPFLLKNATKLRLIGAMVAHAVFVTCPLGAALPADWNTCTLPFLSVVPGEKL